MEVHSDRSTSLRPRRRDVLAYGAGLALLPSISWAGRPTGAALGIGYCRELTGASALDGELPPVELMPAGRLAAGEARLARRGARVTVHGLAGDLGRWPASGIRAAELKIGFPIAEDGLEVLAWSHQLLPVENAGTANALTVPVDRGLALALELETPWSVHERYAATLRIGSEAGEPKLRAGRYLIAPGAPRLLPRRFDPAASAPLIAISIETAS